jgi:hypothetical protein
LIDYTVLYVAGLDWFPRKIEILLVQKSQVIYNFVRRVLLACKTAD